MVFEGIRRYRFGFPIPNRGLKTSLRPTIGESRLAIEKHFSDSKATFVKSSGAVGKFTEVNRRMNAGNEK